MTVTLSATTKIVTFNGIHCRIWEGVSERGVKCHAYIPRIAVANDEDSAQLESELKEMSAPSPALEAIPLRMIL